jgi:hypothetical protein
MVILKDFNDTFFLLCNKLKEKENFAFVRFSDGELDIIQNLYVELSENKVQRGQEVLGQAPYPEEDYKIFDPSKHQKSRNLLLSSLQLKKKNYFKGLTCPCCVPTERVLSLLELYGTGDEEHMVWANQFVNSNYVYFLDYMQKEIIKRDNIVLVANEKVDIDKCDLNVKKHFKVGYNCFVNDLGLIDGIKEYIKNNNIKNHLFLFSAASLSEILIYELYKDFPENTYIDIGTTMHKSLGLNIARDYLQSYWSGNFHPDLHKKCLYPLVVKK